MLTENVLELLRSLDEAATGSGSLGGVSGALDPDAGLVEVVVGRALAECGQGLSNPGVLASSRLVQRRALLQRGRPLEILQQRPVPRRVECKHELPPGKLTLAVEQLENGSKRCAVKSPQLVHEVLDQDVAVTNLAEKRCEPPELRTKALGPLGLRDPLAGRPEKRPDPAGRDPKFVQLLRVGTEPDTPLPRPQLRQLLPQNCLELVVRELRALQSSQGLECK